MSGLGTTPILRKPRPKRQSPIVRAHPLARQFFRLLNVEGIALMDAAERAGVHRSTFTKWKCSHLPALDTLCAALNALGYDLRIVKQYGLRGVRKGGE